MKFLVYFFQLLVLLKDQENSCSMERQGIKYSMFHLVFSFISSTRDEVQFPIAKFIFSQPASTSRFFLI